MRYPKLLSEELLLITPAGYHRLQQTFDHLKGLALQQPAPEKSERQYPSWMTEGPQMEIINGVAVIPVCGPIGRGLDAYDKAYGATDVKDIGDDLDDADEDDSVRAILLDIDSPGGMVAGTPEAADRIAAVSKPIYAFSEGLICSAAYWLASAADGIFATRSADIGSIGVYSAFLDMSEMARSMGIKVQVFSSGTYKGMGVPGTSLTKDQEGLIEARIMEIAEMFYDHVRDTRGDVADEDMQGQTFKASAAAARGLIDQVVTDRDEVIGML